MFKIASILLAAAQIVTAFSPLYLPGDVTGDDIVNISDVTEVLQMLADGENDPLADVTGDGIVSIRDVTALLTAIANPETETEDYGNAVVISTANDLEKLRSNPTADAVLVNDLTLRAENFIPIGSAAKPYSGVFNGLGHTLTLDLTEESNQKSTLVGLFGYVSGRIEHLNLAGSIRATIDSGHIGAIAAILTQGGVIYDCDSSVSITADCKTASAISGLVGSVYNSDAELDGSLRLCRTSGSISATVTSSGAGDGSPLTSGTTGAVGGLLGLSVEGAASDVSRCVNTGNITVTGGKYNIGGIVGQTSSTANATKISISECANKGNITVYKLAGERAAGIIGYIKGGSITSCYNTGSVIAYSDTGSKISREGYGTYFGIFGYANLGSGNRLSVLDCYNASPSPLEAEICVLRNASYGTFRNYYMAGRTEYERELKSSNVSSGAAGKTFSSPEELTEMIVADTNGTYKAANEGYPILAFETVNQMDAIEGAELSHSISGTAESAELTVLLYAADKFADASLRLTLRNREGKVSTRTDALSAIRLDGSIDFNDMSYEAAKGCTLYRKVIKGLTFYNFDLLEIELVFPGDEEDEIVYRESLSYTDYFEAPSAYRPVLGVLPVYPAGKVSAVYNAGPGLAIDKDSETDTDCREVVISDADEASFAEYLEILASDGYEKIFENAVDGNQYRLYQKNEKTYYLGYFGNQKIVRVVEDNASTKPITEISGGITTVSPMLWQYALDFTKGTGQTSGEDYYAIDCGMFYVVRLADNSLFLMDGGHMRQSSDAALCAANDFLHEITCTPADEKVKIAGWYFTHAHGDHVYFAHAFLEKYHDLYDVEAIYGNFPSYRTMSSGYDGGTFDMKATVNRYYPACDYYKLHTGETFSLPGVGFEVLYTHEDSVQKLSGVTDITDFNSSSTVLRLTVNGKKVLFLGDVSGTAEGHLRGIYSAKTLHSDAVQLAHHCINNLPNLYAAISAPLILCPNSEENVDTNHSSKRQSAINGAGSSYRGILYEGDYTYRLSFENDTIEYSIDREIYNTALYFDDPLLGFVGDALEESPVVASVLTDMQDLSALIIDKSARGTKGTQANEAPQRIFDQNTASKWCCTNVSNAYVMFRTSAPVSVGAYQLVAANDTAGFAGRNPKSWTLYGSADGKNWTAIDSVYDGKMNTANYSASTYLSDSGDEEFSYFVLYIHSLSSGTTMQFSELRLYGSAD